MEIKRIHETEEDSVDGTNPLADGGRNVVFISDHFGLLAEISSEFGSINCFGSLENGIFGS